MASQFFKDSNGGNRFVPRSLSLNLGATFASAGVSAVAAVPSADVDPHGGSGVQRPQTLDDSTDSHSSPRDTSTAPSTAVSSNFFHAKRAVNDTGPGGVVGNGSSGPMEKVFKLNVRPLHPSHEEGDDIEITDIREISNPDSSRGEDNTEESQLETSSSSDLLMDALVKSQKLCNGLKQKLECANLKIQSQCAFIESQLSTIETIKGSFKTFKTSMASIQSNLVQLKDSRRSDNDIINTFKVEHSGVLENISNVKSEITSIKKRIDHIRQLKAACTYEFDKKSGEVKALQERLDETSGLLSEQKIKSLDLEKKLESCRLNYDTRVKDLCVDVVSFEKNVITKLNETDNSIKMKIDNQFISGIKPVMDSIENTMEAKFISLTEKFVDSFQISDDQRLRLEKALETTIPSINDQVIELKGLLETKLNNSMNKSTELEKIMSKLEDSFKALKKELQSSHTLDKKESAKHFRALENGIAKLDKVIKDQNLKNDSFENICCETVELSKSKGELQRRIEMLETLKEAMEADLKIKNEKIKTLQLTNNTEGKDVSQLRKKIAKLESELKNTELKLSKEISMNEGKIKVQEDLSNSAIEERDDVYKQFDALQEKISDLNAQLTTYQNIESEKKQSEEEFQKSFETKETTIFLLQRENDELKGELDELKTQINSSKNLEIEDLENTLASPLKLNPFITNRSESAMAAAPGSSTSKSKKRVFSNKSNPSASTIAQTNADLIDDFDIEDDLPSAQPEVIFKPRRYTKRKRTCK